VPAEAGEATRGVDADRAAQRLHEADFVTVSAAATGDALAATGLLVRACRAAGAPFQSRVRPDPETPAPDDDTVTIRVGDEAPADLVLTGGARPASLDAYAVAAAVDGADPSPALALAGVKAAGVTPGADGTGALLDAAKRGGLVARRPGLSVPTSDLADGLASSTRLRAPVSGDSEGARAFLAHLDLPATLGDEAHRRVASLVAVEAATSEGASDRAPMAIEWLLRPYATPEGPFETLGGYADVLDAVAREAPGAGVALALGADEARDAALGAWRDHARGVHNLLDEVTTARYDGVFVARADDAAPGRLATAARLLRDYRSPEPVALVVAEGAAAASATEPAGVRAQIARAAEAVGDGSAFGGAAQAGARFDGDVGEFVQAFTEDRE
jgi:hypothetical protein